VDGPGRRLKLQGNGVHFGDVREVAAQDVDEQDEQYGLQDKQDRLQDMKDGLLDEQNRLQHKQDKLQEEQYGLQNQQDRLQDMKDKLQDEQDRLQDEQDRLKDEQDRLKDEKDRLQDDQDRLQEDFLGKFLMYPVSAEETYITHQKSHFESYKNVPLYTNLFWILCKYQIKGILPHVIADFLISYIRNLIFKLLQRIF